MSSASFSSSTVVSSLIAKEVGCVGGHQEVDPFGEFPVQPRHRPDRLVDCLFAVVSVLPGALLRGKFLGPRLHGRPLVVRETVLGS